MNPNSNNNNNYNQNPNFVDINQMYNYQNNQQPNNYDETFTNPMGIDLKSFLPQQPQQQQQQPPAQIVSQSNDAPIIDDVLKQSECFRAVIANRVKGLKTSATIWQEGRRSEAVHTIQLMQDLGVINDFLSFGLIKSEMNYIDIRSESIIELFPSIINMASSKHDTYVKTAIDAAWVILKLYYEHIIQIKKANLICAGVDLNREEKVRKYDVLINYFGQLRTLPVANELQMGVKKIEGLNARQFFTEVDYFIKQCLIRK